MSILPEPSTAEMCTAYAFSPWITSNVGDCLQFSYYFVNPTVNKLALFIQHDFNYIIPLYSITPYTDKAWVRNVQLKLPSSQLRIMIVGFRSQSPGSLIAIDDVTVSPEVCPQQCKLKIE